MGLFGRLFGRERRDRRRAGLSTTSGPPPKPVPTATYLPDWSEYWLTTTREQAGGSPYPYPYDTEPPARTQIGVRDLAEGAGPDGASVDGGLASGGMESVRPPAGHYGVNLAPVNVLPGEDPPFASDDQAVTYEAPPLTPVTHLTDADAYVHGTPSEMATYQALHPDRTASDRWIRPESATAGRVASELIGHTSGDESHFDRIEVDPWLPADPVAADVSGEVPASPADLPPPVAESVVRDVPAPERWNRVAPPEPAPMDVTPVAAPEPAPMVGAFDAQTEPAPSPGDGLVLDVRDRPEPAADPEPVHPHVVLGFGDGSTRQLDSDDPDVRTFHEIAAALTSGPRHPR